MKKQKLSFLFSLDSVQTSNVDKPSNETKGNNEDNHDECDSCLLGGELICCDNCPRAFHFTCMNPPMMQEDVEGMVGNWYCHLCSAKLAPKPLRQVPKTLFSPLLDKLEEQNPITFKLPSDIKNGISKGEQEHIEQSDGDKKSKKKTKKKDEICAFCSQTGANSEFASCYICNRSYHLYCLEPPLFSVPNQPWQCPEHSDETQQTHLIPELTFKLDFLPNKRRKTQDNQTNGNIRNNTHNELEDPTNLLLNLRNETNWNPQSKESQIRKIIEEQQNLLQLSLPNGSNKQVSPELVTSAAAIVPNLTPLFTQFLAWQRLMHLNVQLQSLNSPNYPTLTNGKSSSTIQSPPDTGNLLEGPPSEDISTPGPKVLTNIMKSFNNIRNFNNPSIYQNNRNAFVSNKSNISPTQSAQQESSKKSVIGSRADGDILEEANFLAEREKKRGSLKQRATRNSNKEGQTEANSDQDDNSSDDDSKEKKVNKKIKIKRSSTRSKRSSKQIVLNDSTPNNNLNNNNATPPPIPSSVTPSSENTITMDMEVEVSDPIVIRFDVNPDEETEQKEIRKENKEKDSVDKEKEKEKEEKEEKDKEKDNEDKDKNNKENKENKDTLHDTEDKHNKIKIIKATKDESKEKSEQPTEPNWLSKIKFSERKAIIKLLNKPWRPTLYAKLLDKEGRVFFEMKKDNIIIGRRKENVDLDLSEHYNSENLRFLSRNHAFIKYNKAEKKFSVLNLGRNALKLNGKPLEDQEETLNSGDEIIIAKFRIIFVPNPSII